MCVVYCGPNILSVPLLCYKLRKILQHIRHVEASYWYPNKSTHFNRYFDEDNSSYPRQIPAEMYKLLGFQWLVSTCRLCCRIFCNVEQNSSLNTSLFKRYAEDFSESCVKSNWISIVITLSLDWFGTKQISVWWKINRKSVITMLICFFDLPRYS